MPYLYLIPTTLPPLYATLQAKQIFSTVPGTVPESSPQGPDSYYSYCGTTILYSIPVLIATWLASSPSPSSCSSNVTLLKQTSLTKSIKQPHSSVSQQPLCPVSFCHMYLTHFIYFLTIPKKHEFLVYFVHDTSPVPGI